MDVELGAAASGCSWMDVGELDRVGGGLISCVIMGEERLDASWVVTQDNCFDCGGPCARGSGGA